MTKLKRITMWVEEKLWLAAREESRRVGGSQRTKKGSAAHVARLALREYFSRKKGGQK